MHAVLFQPPVRPSLLNPDIPALLEALILQMLEKEAHLRPTAAEVDVALAELIGKGAGPLLGAVPTPVPRHTIGRQAELAELRAGLESAVTGRGLFLCLTGEPGMVDLLRHLRGRQVLAQDQGRCVLVQSVPDLQRELPESVRSMIERKIAQLGDEDRRLLVAASVRGFEFAASVVAQALALDAADVEGQLERLERVHAFIRLVGEHEFPDMTQTVRYRFEHVLNQNVLYASLRPTRRASLSAAVAQTMVGYHGEKNAAVAGELALLWDAAREFARAADSFLRAAQNAACLFADQEAVVLARRELKRLEALPDAAKRSRQELALLIALGPPLIAIKGWTEPEFERLYTCAQALCRQVGETPQLFQTLWGMWFFYIGMHDIYTYLNVSEQLLSLARGTGDPALFLRAHHALGPTYLLAGDLVSAHAHLEQGIAVYEPQQHRARSFTAAMTRASAAGAMMPGACGRWVIRIRPCEAVRRPQSWPGSCLTPLRWRMRSSTALLRVFRRERLETQKQAEKLANLSAERGLPTYLAGASPLKGWAQVEGGHREEGSAQIRQCLTAPSSSAPYHPAHFRVLLAEACEKRHEPDEGTVVLEEALKWAADTRVGFYESEIHRVQGMLRSQPSEQNGGSQGALEFH
jgi:hypothetical protein